MRRVDWFLAGVIGLFLAGGLIWQTLAWMGAVASPRTRPSSR
jgi:hypothetical protein